MSEAEPKPPKKKICPKEPLRSALIALINESKVLKEPNLTAVARRFNVKYGSLKAYFYRWREGEIDLADIEENQGLRIEVDTKQELDRCLRIVKETEQVLNDAMELVVVKIKNSMVDKGPDAIFDHKLDKLMQMQFSAGRLREMKEKGYIALIEALQRADEIRKRRQEEEMQTVTLPQASTRTLNADEIFERLARERREVQEGVTQ